MRKRASLKLIAGAVAASAAMALTACGGPSGQGSTDDKTLNVLSWETYHDKAQLDAFTEKTGIKVNIVNVGSPDEMFAKVKSAPSQWDLALVTSGWYDNYTNANLLEPIDTSKVTALNDMKLGFDWKAAASSKDGKLYGVLYNWGNQPLAWTDDAALAAPGLNKYKDEKGQFNDWNVLWDPALAGKVSMFDESQAVLNMVCLTLGFEDPFNLSEEQFNQVKAKLAELRPQIKRLTSGFNDQTDQLAGGEASLAYLNNIASAKAVKAAGKTLNVNNLIKQGVPAWSDNYSIVKEGGGKKLDAAYEFINYTMTPEWQAKFVTDSSNNGILDYAQATSDAAKSAGLTDEVLSGTLIPATRDGEAFFSKMVFGQTPEDAGKRVEIWNEFKLGLGS
ncbi:ABC transporter substrate-binding protein [[Micrococcus luteus] ATCC 49442]|uniref:ABC transporter substrate-binding protein n=1 Tax=[Micrococcus luteus] ATCC 49442 TaxID=2698727 RepID=UPI0013D95E38|nr:extracellular solute-binding protein [[Micrococcus luteus] ATCC 49442]